MADEELCKKIKTLDYKTMPRVYGGSSVQEE